MIRDLTPKPVCLATLVPGRYYFNHNDEIFVHKHTHEICATFERCDRSINGVIIRNGKNVVMNNNAVMQLKEFIYA